jgi:low affinity Fe/Cu permease
VRAGGSAPPASVAALLFVGLWLVAGPFYGWSSNWQLIINTSSSVVTLVMVFMIQNTQRRDTQAIQLKLDELIRVDSEARNELISLEAKPETAVAKVRSAFDESHDGVEEEDTPPVAR